MNKKQLSLSLSLKKNLLNAIQDSILYEKSIQDAYSHLKSESAYQESKKMEKKLTLLKDKLTNTPIVLCKDKYLIVYACYYASRYQFSIADAWSQNKQDSSFKKALVREKSYLSMLSKFKNKFKSFQLQDLQ